MNTSHHKFAVGQKVHLVRYSSPGMDDDVEWHYAGMRVVEEVVISVAKPSYRNEDGYRMNEDNLFETEKEARAVADARHNQEMESRKR